MDFRIAYLRQHCMAAFQPCSEDVLLEQQNKPKLKKIKMWCEEVFTWQWEISVKGRKLLTCTKIKNDMVAETFSAIWLVEKLDKLRWSILISKF